MEAVTALPGHAVSPVGDSDCCLARVFCGLPPKELHPRCVQQIDVSNLAASLLHQGTHP